MSVAYLRPERPKGRSALALFRDRGFLFDRLDRLAALVHEAADALPGLARSDQTTHAATTMIGVIEAESVRVTVDIEEGLRRTFSLSVDRADVHELAAHLTGVLGLVARSVRTGFGPAIAGSEPTARLVDLLVRSTSGIAPGVAALRTNDHVVMSQVARELRTLQRDAGVAHDDALAALLREDGRDARELTRTAFALEDLKQTTRRCGETAAFLAYLAVKLA